MISAFFCYLCVFAEIDVDFTNFARVGAMANTAAQGQRPVLRRTSMLSPDDARMLVDSWNKLVARDRKADIGSLANGKARAVGSLIVQYDSKNATLIARGVLLMDTGDLLDIEDSFQRLVRYVKRHPARVEKFRLDNLSPGDTADAVGHFTLRFDFQEKVSTEKFIEIAKDLSKTAYQWTSNGYYRDAQFGR